MSEWSQSLKFAQNVGRGFLFHSTFPTQWTVQQSQEVKMSPQGVMSSKKANYHPGLSPVKGHEAVHSPHLQRLIDSRVTCWPLKLKVMLWNDISSLDDYCSTSFENVGIGLQTDAASHPRRTESSLRFYLVSANCCRKRNSTGEMLLEWCEDPTCSSDQDSLCESDRGHLVCCRWACCWEGMIFTLCMPFAGV